MTGAARAAAAAGCAVLALTATACHGMRPTAATGPGGKAATPHSRQAAADRVIAGIHPDAALARRVPADLKATGLRVASSLGYPPMEMFDDDQTTAIGVDPTLGRAVGKVLGLPVRVRNEDFNAQVPGVLTRRYDLAMSSMSDTAERRAKVDMIDYLRDGQAFLVRKGNPEGVRTAADVCGRKLAVVDNGSALDFATRFGKRCTARGAKPPTVLKFTGDQDAVLQVQEGRAAADINDYPVARYRAAGSHGRLEAVTIAGTSAPFGAAVRPGRPKVAAVIRDALRALVKDGTYRRLLAAWDVTGMAVPGPSGVAIHRGR